MNETTIKTAGKAEQTPAQEFSQILGALLNAQEWRYTDDEKATAQAVFHLKQALGCFTR